MTPKSSGLPALEIVSAGRTEQGPRARNEDGFLRRDLGDVGIYAVADGLGGLVGGRVASSRALTLLGERVDDVAAAARGEGDGALARRLASILVEIDGDLRRLGQEDPVLAGMGTTLTVAAIGPGRLAFAHAGDSRLYLATAGSPLRRLTEDMNLAARMLREGRLSEAEFAKSPHRARLLAFLGKGSVEPQSGEQSLAPGAEATIVLATDGLIGPVSDAEIAVATETVAEPDALAESLVRLAMARGASDNVTVVAAACRTARPPSTEPDGIRHSKDLESCGSAGSD